LVRIVSAVNPGRRKDNVDQIIWPEKLKKEILRGRKSK
jgi:hypothetical protein